MKKFVKAVTIMAIIWAVFALPDWQSIHASLPKSLWDKIVLILAVVGAGVVTALEAEEERKKKREEREKRIQEDLDKRSSGGKDNKAD